MKTLSALSTENNNAKCIDINSPAYTKADNYLMINKKGANATAKGEKAIIINMFQNHEIDKATNEKFTYTIKQGDDKKLNKNGVLTVYNMSEPVDIPIEKLLGKWSNTHIGITLIAVNQRWMVKGDMQTMVFKQESSVQSAFQKILKFVMA